jgi:choline dehydrogenase-like flavoprotein
MIYSRGPSEEYDRMARVSGDSGWSWDSLQKYIYKVRFPLCSFQVSDCEVEREAYPTLEQQKQRRRIRPSRSRIRPAADGLDAHCLRTRLTRHPNNI